MTITPYLAMTAAEMKHSKVLPGKVAWMACHFSLYSTGLSNIPRQLPKDAMLIVNDIIPMNRHDPDFIASQLKDCVEEFRCCCILLDFQPVPSPQIRQSSQTLLKALPCPLAVTESLAVDLPCPVFLSPCPPQKPLAEHLSPWIGRDIWIEIAKEATIITITKNGTKITHEPITQENDKGFYDDHLNCHYNIHQTEGESYITLWRTQEDWNQILQKAAAMGVSRAAALYQEKWI